MSAGRRWRAFVIAVCVQVACGAPDVAPTTAGAPRVAIDAAPDSPSFPGSDAAIVDGPDGAPDAGLDAATAEVLPPADAAAVVSTPQAPTGGEVWLKGSTHVHGRPSGDSTTPIADVIRWYEQRRYDFIVLSDHNQTSELSREATPTDGQPAISAPGSALIVLAGIELTHNPSNCLPAGDPSGKCRIHVNLLGVTARVTGKLTWANRKTSDRILKYEAALAQQKLLGGIAQLNHPNWFWGMNGDLLAELARRGFHLVEIANSAFRKWNAGDKDHPSLEAQWDTALQQGVTLWGVASDDAHDYDDLKSGKYPAGGGWVVVKAVRDPAAILAALEGGRFYASNGPVLSRAEVDSGTLVVEVAKGERGSYTIELIENGKRVARVKGRSARRAVPASGYVRAVVTRDDGTKAWVQPARR